MACAEQPKKLLTATEVAMKLANAGGIERWRIILQEWLDSYTDRWKEDEKLWKEREAALSRPKPEPSGCRVNPVSSRGCEYGTPGCEVQHPTPERKPMKNWLKRNWWECVIVSLALVASYSFLFCAIIRCGLTTHAQKPVPPIHRELEMQQADETKKPEPPKQPWAREHDGIVLDYQPAQVGLGESHHHPEKKCGRLVQGQEHLRREGSATHQPIR